ncbi:MAG: hypothetical protein WBZ36_24940 [Candidatus Nitrosopolaris sp.]
MKYKTPMVALPLLLIGIGVGATNHALAWGYWDGGGSYGGHGGGYYWQQPGPGSGAYDNGYDAGISDAVYDHDNGLAYNPVGQCLPCHSQVYWNGFHHGYDTQWNSYQGQNTDQRVN